MSVAFAWIMVGCAAAAAGDAAAAKRPNVVVFLVDDMGWQETSVPFHTETTALNRRYRTPNMERMAAAGVKFTQAYASAVCSATRISLLSGMNVARHRVTNWTLRKDRSPNDPNKSFAAPAWHWNGATIEQGVSSATRITPLPMLLRESGYHTIHVGKAHFGARGAPGEDPKHFGFDVNIAGHAAGAPGSYWAEKNYSSAWRKGDRIWDVPGLDKYHGSSVNLTEALTREAIAALENAKSGGKPFFLYFAHYAVHSPLEYDHRFHKRYLDAGLKPKEAALASMVEGMDKSLGDLLDALRRLGVERETVVMFLSDNGSAAGNPPNLPLRGQKLSPYEGGIRVPMLVQWPGVGPAGAVQSNPVVVEDLLPTILELCGVDWRGKTRQAVDGVSFAPLFRNPAATPAERTFVWHYPHFYAGQTPFSALRQGPWKLIHHHAARRLELFHLPDDVGEKRDVAASQPEVVQRLAKLLGERLRSMDAQMPSVASTGKPVEWADELIPR